MRSLLLSYAFLAFVPMIAALVLLFGLLADPSAVIEGMSQIDDFVPDEVAAVLQGQLLSIVNSNAKVQGIGLVIALLIAVFGAMRASTAIMKALNIIYEEPESRNIAEFYWVSATITLGMIGLGIVGILSASFFSYAQILLSEYLGGAAVLIIKLATWLVAGLMVNLTFAAFYRYAPDRKAAKWQWFTFGSIVATFLWIGATFAFGIYAANVGGYNATYGSLAAVVIFQMWLFLTVYAILIGAEIDVQTNRRDDYVALDAAKAAITEKKQRRKSRRSKK